MTNPNLVGSLMKSSNLVDMDSSQLHQLKENYINMIIDGMDMDSLCQMAFDLLMDAYDDADETAMKEEILDLYDSEVLDDLMETVTV